MWNFTDISHCRELEYEVRQAQKMELVGQLATGVVHDFNNLLTGINGNLAILEMEMATKKINLPERKNLKFAIQAGVRAGELAKQLLGFSRRDHSNPDSYPVTKVVSEVTGILKASIDPSTTFEIEISDDIWTARGDSNMCSQVLVNLMKNAHEAMPDGGTIKVTAKNESLAEKDSELAIANGDYVHLTVADTGMGMPKEVSSKIFDAFYTTKDAGKGTGLGLSTSLKIINRMGGCLSVDSEEGKGTRFDIYLPRGECGQEKKTLAIPKSKDLQIDSTPKETVLIVDDEEMVRMVAVTRPQTNRVSSVGSFKRRRSPPGLRRKTG